MQPKKQLILLVLNELNINSDESHPLTQTQIAKNLSGEKYTCDRKTVCRNIKLEDAYNRIKNGENYIIRLKCQESSSHLPVSLDNKCHWLTFQIVFKI